MEDDTIPFSFIDLDDEKPTSLLYAVLQSQFAFLLRSSYHHQYSILTELDVAFAFGKIRPSLCILSKRKADWLEDEIIVQQVPITTIEILSPEQSLNSLTDRIYKKHFPAGVKTVWLVVPTVRMVSILLPNRQQLNFSQGQVTDPVTGIQLALKEIFEG
jgi:Uma2 family endonuclease